jgi:hypothetical protein
MSVLEKCRRHLASEGALKLMQSDMVRFNLCLNDGRPLVQPSGRGRPRRFCSDRCKNAYHYRRLKQEAQIGRQVLLQEEIGSSEFGDSK